MSETNKLVRPFLKWAGGKRQLAHEITPYCKNYKTYYEPFVGAGAILFTLQPESAVINDLNEQLIITYKAIQDNVYELLDLLQYHKENNSKEYYYEIRDLDRKSTFNGISDVEKAARMIYLNKTCYNGLYRVNSQGLFNTPYGSYKNPTIYEKEVLLAVSDYLGNNNITILNADFSKAVESATKGDLVYFDPPYDSPNSTNFTGYQMGGFDHEQQIRLKNVITVLTSKEIRCILSNSSTIFIKELYNSPDFVIKTVEANRPINSNASERGKVDELLIRNWK